MLEYDRGYATGSLNFRDDEILDAGKAASFLCSSCMNDIIPKETGQCFGVGAIDLATKKVRLFVITVDLYWLNIKSVQTDKGDIVLPPILTVRYDTGKFSKKVIEKAQYLRKTEDIVLLME